MTSISTKAYVYSSMPRGARRIDLAATIKSRHRALRTRLEGRDSLLEAVREANASVDPAKVASWLVRRANEWIPAPCWALVSSDGKGGTTVLADLGMAQGFTRAVTAVGQWVVQKGAEFYSADLSTDGRLPQGAGTGTAVAFPLVCRNRTIGALVGLDEEPSAAAPSLPPAILEALSVNLEPAAIALDNGLALQRFEALSVTDDLTRLYNSRYLHQVLRRETKRAARSGRPLSLLFIDLDGFKSVNDSHGHLAGSKALVEAAGIVRGSARETDVAARFGGDEFAVILPDTGREGAVSVAERVRDRIRAFEFLASDGLQVRLTASIGVATLPDCASSAEELLRAADSAMYKVKAAGKNGILVLTPDS